MDVEEAARFGIENGKRAERGESERNRRAAYII